MERLLKIFKELYKNNYNDGVVVETKLKIHMMELHDLIHILEDYCETERMKIERFDL